MEELALCLRAVFYYPKERFVLGSGPLFSDLDLSIQQIFIENLLALVREHLTRQNSFCLKLLGELLHGHPSFLSFILKVLGGAVAGIS